MTAHGNDAAAWSLLPIRVIPRSKRNEVGGKREGRLIVRTTAPPVDGKANRLIVAQVAEHLGLPKRDVTLESGHRSRDKVLRVRQDPARQLGKP
jgi:uncharacterized protein (TIGR00251 family)